MTGRASTEEQEKLSGYAKETAFYFESYAVHKRRNHSSPHSAAHTWERDRKYVKFGLLGIIGDVASLDLELVLVVGRQPIDLYVPRHLPMTNSSKNPSQEGKPLLPVIQMTTGDILGVTACFTAWDTLERKENLFLGDKESQQYVTIDGVGHSIANPGPGRLKVVRSSQDL